MFLYFHRKFSMILFVPKILDHMQIKTLIVLSFWFYKSITYKKKHTHTHTHIPFYYAFLIHPYVITDNKKFKIKQTTHHTNKKLQNSPKTIWNYREGLLHHRNSGGASPLRTTPLAVRGFTRRREEETGNSRIWLNLFSSSLPCQRWKPTSPAKEKKHKQSFGSSSPF